MISTRPFEITMLRGTFTALITPFDSRGEFDKTAFYKILSEQVAAGVEGVVVVGTTGESPTVSHEENIQIVEYAVDVIAGQIKVIAGTGSNCTQEAISLTKKAAGVGADAALLVTPYYNRPSQEGLFQHFRAIAEEVPQLPQILYDVPCRTGISLQPETVLRLAQIPNIIALKDATGLFETVEKLSGKLPEYFSLLSGNDDIAVELIKRGAQGVISVASNLYPIEMKSMIDAALAGNFEVAEKMSRQWNDFFKACFCESNPVPIKTMMAMAGKCNEKFRLPLCPLSSEHRVQVEKYIHL